MWFPSWRLGWARFGRSARRRARRCLGSGHRARGDLHARSPVAGPAPRDMVVLLIFVSWSPPAQHNARCQLADERAHRATCAFPPLPCTVPLATRTTRLGGQLQACAIQSADELCVDLTRQYPKCSLRLAGVTISSKSDVVLARGDLGQLRPFMFAEKHARADARSAFMLPEQFNVADPFEQEPARSDSAPGGRRRGRRRRRWRHNASFG